MDETFKNHAHKAGSRKDGDPYYVGEVEYQRYWCRFPDCAFSIPVRTGNTR